MRQNLRDASKTTLPSIFTQPCYFILPAILLLVKGLNFQTQLTDGPMKHSCSSLFQVRSEPKLTIDEAAAVGGGSLLANFTFFREYSTPGTQLFWVKVLTENRLVAVLPVVRLVKRKATDMLRTPWKAWLGMLFGPLARKTTLLVDTAFMAYDDRSPFCFRDPDPSNENHLAIKQAVSNFLKAQRGVHTIWITEPADQAKWTADENYDCFGVLPMVHVPLQHYQSMDQYVADLSKKRRRNYRAERKKFIEAGATIDFLQGPLEEPIARQLQVCLEASAKHSSLEVPYNDVMTNPKAFQAQTQQILIAYREGRVIGFMSFLVDGKRFLQCHGGLDYHHSYSAQAYHNLIYAAIEHAIQNGYQRLSMGPLNNETKRRLGQELKPMTACLWNRYPLDRLIARKLFIKNFEVAYRMCE